MEIIIIFVAACVIQLIAVSMKPAEPQPWKYKKRSARTNKSIETMKNM